MLVFQEPPELTAEEYCTKPINLGEENEFSPCQWVEGDSNKGGLCQSKCKQHNPTEGELVTSISDLQTYKDMCVSDQWYPDDDVHRSLFPQLQDGIEQTENYFNDRYCTWMDLNVIILYRVSLHNKHDAMI